MIFNFLLLLVLHASLSNPSSYSLSPSSSMTFKISHFLFTLLWISLLLLFLHELNLFKPKFNPKPSPTITFSSTRKVLANKVDFTPFVHHHGTNRPAKHSHPVTDDNDDIDPRYGVEKRRVPTGPNPLHH